MPGRCSRGELVVTTALEVAGFALIAAAVGLTFGFGAFLAAAGVAFVVVGIALEGQGRRAEPDAEPSSGSTRSST